MNLTIKQLSIIEGCCERNAKAIKRKILVFLMTAGNKTISDIDVSVYYGVPLESISLSLDFQRSAFIRLKDIVRLFGVELRQASNIKSKISRALHKKKHQRISVYELSACFGIHHSNVFTLMNDAIREKGIKPVTDLNVKERSIIEFYNEEHRNFVSISELPKFWTKHIKKFEGQPAFAWNAFVYSENDTPGSTVNKV